MNKKKTKLWTKNFIFIILINFLVFMNHIMILSIFPFYIESLNGTEAIAGLAVTLFCLVSVICRPIVGWLLDSGKRKLILIVGIIVMALMPMGYMAVSILAVAFVCRMIHGAALACSNTSTSTIATDIIPKERFAEGMGMFGMATALATSCAPALGLFLMDQFGYNAVFFVATGALVIAFLLYLMMKVPHIPVEKKKFQFTTLLDKNALPASTVMLVFLFTFGALENFLAKYAVEAQLPSGGIFFAIMACMLVLTRATLGKVADNRGEAVFVYTCNISMFLAFILLALFPNTITFVIAAALAGYGFGGLEPTLQSMAVHIAPPERRGAANSTFLCAYDIGIGLGGGMAGYLISALGYSQMFLILSITNIFALILYVVWVRNHPSSFSYIIRQKKMAN